MYFGRNLLDENQETSRKPLPHEWTEEFTKVLTETYFERSEKDNRFFVVYGEIYDKDFVVVISYIHHDDQLKSPISLFISHDVLEDSKKFKSTLKNLVDFTGIVLDDVFATDEWSDYNNTWTENEYKGSNFFYKITRENISLTLQAEQFLEKNGEI